MALHRLWSILRASRLEDWSCRNKRSWLALESCVACSTWQRREDPCRLGNVLLKSCGTNWMQPVPGVGVSGGGDRYWDASCGAFWLLHCPKHCWNCMLRSKLMLSFVLSWLLVIERVWCCTGMMVFEVARYSPSCVVKLRDSDVDAQCRDK